MAAIDQVAALVLKWGPIIAEAFSVAIAGIKSRIVLARITERLQAGDLDGAIEAIGVESPAFITLETELRNAFIDGGTTLAKTFPRLPSGSKIQLLFDIRNPDAEAFLKDHSADLVTGIVADQNASIRQILTDGMMKGQNPTNTALDVVGRVNRATGQREGGIIGLTQQQAQYVASAREELASTDAKVMRNYLTRTLRDKRYDATVKAALEAGNPVPADTAAKITERYAARLLKLRGDMIGRTETLTAINTSDDIAFRQGLAKTNYTEADVVRVWKSVGDDRVRHTHRELNNKQAVGLDAPFVSPSGAQMRYPGDASLGAPGSELIGCRCRVQRKFDFFARVL